MVITSRGSFDGHPLPTTSPRQQQPRRKHSRFLPTCTLLGALLLLVGGQFVLFPFLLTLVADPVALQGLGFQQQSSLANLPNQHQSLRQQQQQQQQQQQRKLPSKPADATLNGVPLYLQTTTQSPLVSHVHCVGENYQTDAWKQRSCRMENLCFNLTNKEFILFESNEEQHFAQEYLAQRPFLHTSSTLMRYGPNQPQTMGLGGINLKWGKDGIPRLQWFPTVLPVPNPQQEPITYYSMPEDMVWIPFHSMNGANPGHLVWDDFLPMYTLLDMFQLLNDSDQQQHTVLPMRYILTNGERGLWASCDLRQEKTEACKKMMQKFMPLLVGEHYPYQFTTTQDFDFQQLSATGKDEAPTDLVCSKTGLAGISAITDHGVNKMHGWEEEDYLFNHNHGRGGNIYKFRNFMMQNMGFVGQELLYQKRMYEDGKRYHRIVFSTKSSEIFIRKMDFERQMQIVRHSFSDTAKVEGYTFKDHSTREQLEIVHDASIFVTLCGGGAVTGMFLPKGASIFLYYAEDGGSKNNRMTYKPALLDWDLFNAMSHLRVHWLPRNTMKTETDEDMLVELIRHELSLMDKQVFN